MGMKRRINLDDVLDCIANGVNTASAIGNRLGFSCSSIFSFCQRRGISLQYNPRGGRNAVDMTGTLDSGVVVVKRVESDTSLSKSRRKLAVWECVCPCGKSFRAVGSDIRLGRVKTCGCRISIKSKCNWQGGRFVPKGYWSNLHRNAEVRGMSVSVSLEYLDGLFESQQGRCALSGIPISFRQCDCTASLDRKDSSIGYVAGNVQWVHKHINFMKSDHDEEYFVEMCRLVAMNCEHMMRSNPVRGVSPLEEHGRYESALKEIGQILARNGI